MSRSLSTAAAAAAGVLGGVAIATAVPGLTLVAPVGSVQVDDLTAVEDDEVPEDAPPVDVHPDDDAADDVPDPDATDPEVPDDEDLAATVDDGPDEADDDADDAFSTWVRSLPDDWGCVRGLVISANARGDKDGFEGPSYGSIEEAVADLDLEGRCVDVAVARQGSGGEDDDTPRVERGDAGPPEGRPGPPDHARGPARSAEARDGAPGRDADRGGPPADRGGPPEGVGPRSGVGPPAGFGPR